MDEKPDKFDLRSQAIAEDKQQELLKLFPEIRTEGGKIDLEKLKLALGEIVDLGKERYGMNWPGKADCFKTIQTPSLGTLLPCPEESVNFNTTENIFIEGDNLEVLKLLQKSYMGKIKMIYIDPPYNIGDDFIYPDDYTESLQTYLEYTGQVDAQGKRFGTNTDTNGRFHSKWINMMYPRLYLAKNLLREDGICFISIHDKEFHNLRILMNEIFGEDNFIANIVWNSEGHTDNQYDVKINHEYILIFCKNSDFARLGYVIDPNTREESNLWKGYAENSITKNGAGNPPSEVILPKGFPVKVEHLDLSRNEPKSDFFKEIDKVGYITRQMTEEYNVVYPIRKDQMVAIQHHLTEPCRVFSGWANVNKLQDFIKNNFNPITEKNGDKISFYISENGVIYYYKERDKARNILSVLRNMGTTEQMSSELESMGISFSYPKPKELIKYILKIGSDENDYVLDFFAGSGTTAHAVVELNKDNKINRKFIMVQLPEPCGKETEPYKAGYQTISDICKERIRRVIKKINNEEDDNLTLEKKDEPDYGFRVYKLAESNFKTWDANIPHEASELEKQIELHIDHIRKDRSSDDILFEILLKDGFPLTAPIEKIEFNGKSVFSVANGTLLVCLEKDLTMELIRAIAEKKPERVVCLDEGFAGNDQLKANAVQIFKSKGVPSFKTI